MKKRISLAIAVIMIMTHLLSIVSFADFSDVTEDNSYRQAIITLSKLGVINGYEESDKTFTFRPEGAITRAEFTKMLVTALGRGGHTTEPTEFSDVAGHWARFNIKTAYDMGIINGFDDGTFRPDEQVTYEQALKMMVCTLGYIDFAEGKGGWPNGYTSQANELGLTKGVTNQKNSEAALRQVIAQVVYNALEVHKMEKGVTGDYEQTTKTILNNDLKVYKVKGTLVGMEDVQTDECSSNLLNYQMSVKEGNTETIIDVRDYKELTVAGLQQYVGKQVTVYYSEPRSNDDKSLVVFDADSVKNTTYEISYEDIVSYDGSTLKYYEENAIRSSTLKTNLANMTIIYNGQTLNADDTYTLVNRDDSNDSYDSTGKQDVATKILDPSSDYFIYGDVTFTDSGADGTIDMATINNYSWMVAHRSVSSTDYKVQNSLVDNDTLVLDPNDTTGKVYVEKNGKEVEPTAISSGDVLTYTKSFDGKIKRVFVSKETVTGEVNSLSEGEGKIIINNKEYNLDKNCVQYMKKKNYIITTGKNVTMYLDKMGTVVYGTVKAEAAIPYGYIAKVTEVSEEDALYIKAFIPSITTKKLSSYKLSDSAKINGKKVDDYSEAQELLAASASGEETKNNADVDEITKYINAKTGNNTSTDYESDNTEHSQIARIKVEDNEITEIITLDSTADLGTTNNNNSVIIKYSDLKKYGYDKSSFKLDESLQFSVNSSTVIIDVPADRYDEEGYMKKTTGNFPSETEYCYAEAYDVNSSRVAGLVIRYAIGTETRETPKSKDSQHSVVAGKVSEAMEGDTTVSKIPLYEASETAVSKSINDDADDEFDFDIGDVIQYDLDAENKIKNIEYVLKYADIKDVLDRGAKVKNGDATMEEDEILYNWNKDQTQTDDNRYQFYVFDFKFPKSNASANANYYVTANTNSGAHSRATMFNVINCNEETGEILVTKNGFDENKVLNTSDFEKFTISSSTKIIKLASNGRGFTTVNEKEEDLSIKDLKGEEDSYGLDCSKIMISTIGNSVKLVVIYE